MHGKNALRELGQMAGGQADDAGREGQQQRVLAVAGTAREPPDQEPVDAYFQDREEFVVVGFRLRERLDARRKAVAPFLFPRALGKERLDRSADRDHAAKDDAVVGEVDEEASEGPGKRRRGMQPQEPEQCPGKRQRPTRAARRAGRRAVASTGQPPRPLEEAQACHRRHCDGGAFQAHPRQREGQRRKRPPPARRVAREETHEQQQQPEHEQHQGCLQAEQHAGLRIERRQDGEQQDPGQTRHARRDGDQGHANGKQPDLERLEDEQRLGLVDYPVEGREQEQPQRVVAVGAREAAVEGRELALGHVVGDLVVVERIVVAHVPHQVDEVEAVEHVPGEDRPVGQDAHDEQREQHLAQRRRQGERARMIAVQPSAQRIARRPPQGPRLLQISSVVS